MLAQMRNDEWEFSIREANSCCGERKGDQTFQSSLCRWQYNSRDIGYVKLESKSRHDDGELNRT